MSGERELLREFVEWYERFPPGGHNIEKFLADRRDPDEDDLGQFRECPSCAAKPGSPTLCADCLERRDAYEERKRRGRPFVESTEVVGRFRKYDHCAIVVDRPDGVTGYLKLEDVLPDEATTPEHEGPRGRFRITVEFTPDSKEKP